MSVIESEKRFFIVLLPLWEEKVEELVLLVGVEGGVSVGDTGLKVADGIVANVGRKPSAIFTIQNHGSGVVSSMPSAPLHKLSPPHTASRAPPSRDE